MPLKQLSRTDVLIRWINYQINVFKIKYRSDSILKASAKHTQFITSLLELKNAQQLTFICMAIWHQHLREFEEIYLLQISDH